MTSSAKPARQPSVSDTDASRVNARSVRRRRALSGQRWRLQDAKARFSELVRLAHSEGPQHVTLHGRDAVVVVDAAEFVRMSGLRTGQLLIESLQASPYREIDLAVSRGAMPVRKVSL